MQLGVNHELPDDVKRLLDGDAHHHRHDQVRQQPADHVLEDEPDDGELGRQRCQPYLGEENGDRQVDHDRYHQRGQGDERVDLHPQELVGGVLDIGLHHPELIDQRGQVERRGRGHRLRPLGDRLRGRAV